jgi:hypothetical protein
LPQVPDDQDTSRRRSPSPPCLRVLAGFYPGTLIDGGAQLRPNNTPTSLAQWDCHTVCGMVRLTQGEGDGGCSCSGIAIVQAMQPDRSTLADHSQATQPSRTSPASSVHCQRLHATKVCKAASFRKCRSCIATPNLRSNSNLRSRRG